MQKEKDMTVSDLITFWKGTNADYFNLVADGKIIPRYKKLREAGISVTSKVELIERKISFTVTLQNQCPFTVVLSPSNTLLDVKQYIEATPRICYSYDGPRGPPLLPNPYVLHSQTRKRARA